MEAFFYIKWNMVIDQNVLKVLFILFGWKPGRPERAHSSWWWLLMASPVVAPAWCSFNAQTDPSTYDIWFSFIQCLGGNLVELRGRTVLDDGTLQRLPLLPQLGVALVPGQTLPHMIFVFLSFNIWVKTWWSWEDTQFLMMAPYGVFRCCLSLV